MSTTSDRSLLLGVMAYQMGFVSRDDLLLALQVWSSEKSQPLERIWSQNGILREDTRELLAALVEKHVELHAGDVQQSLSSLSSIGSLRDELAALGDVDIDATLQVMSARPPSLDPYATVPPQPATRSDGDASSPDRASDPETRFRILRPHARGGLGEVSVARDEELNREVALKEIQSRFADDPDSRARFLLEAEITGGLEHPGIVPVYGLGQYRDGRPFYAMRFIRGDSLQESTDRFHQAQDGVAGLELRKLLGRFVDVCQAMEYAHSRGVLHRDLKPGNIMLGKYGETLVVDWGLAKPVGAPGSSAKHGESTLTPQMGSGSAPTQLGSALGTPGYMSPEQAAGQIEALGPAADVYCLGATLYYVLTGQTPVKGDTLASVLQKVKTGDFTRPRQVKPNVPKPLEAICLKAMALRCEDRYDSPMALADDVERYLADEPVTAMPESFTQRCSRWLRRNRTYARAAAAALLAITIVSVVAVIFINKARQREHEQRHEATQRLAQSRRIIDDMLTDMALNLRSVPGTQRIERALLERAALEYQAMANEKSDVRELQSESGLASMRLAGIQRLLGRFGEAETSVKQSLQILQAQFDESPTNLKLEHLAWAEGELGSLYRASGRLAEAEQAIRGAIKKWAQLVSNGHGSWHSQIELARQQNQLGVVLKGLDRSQEGLQFLEQAEKQFAILAEEHPQNMHVQYDLASCLTSIGLIHQQNGRSTEAGQMFRLGIEHASIVANSTSALGVSPQLTLIRENLGMLLVDLGQLDEAHELMTESIRAFEPIARANADIPDNLMRLCDYRRRLASVERQRGNAEAAEELLNEANHDAELLATRFPDDPSHLNTWMDGLIEIAMIQFNAGKFDDSARSAESAAQASQQLVDRFPDQPKYLVRLGNAYTHLGRAQRRLNQLVETRESWQRSIEVLRAAVDAHPSEVSYRDKLALALANQGSLLLQLQDIESAVTTLEDAVAQYQTLSSENADRPGYRERLLMTYSQLGPAINLAGDPDRALALMKTAAEDGKQLVESYPDNPRYQQRLADVYLSLVAVEPQEDEKAQWLQLALETIGELREQFPESATYRRMEYTARLNHALNLTQQRRFQEAVTMWQSIPEESPIPLPPYVPALRALALAETTGRERALELIAEIDPSTTEDAYTLGFAAQVHAAAYRKAIESDTLTEAERTTLLNMHATKALSLIRAAADAGWFESDADVAEFKEAFEPLLARPEFAAFLRKIEDD